MNCKDCFEKKRADYWHTVASVSFSVIGGIMGAVLFWLFCK